MKMRRQTEKLRKGFTLIELLVVILIISMIAALVAPKIFTGLGKAKRDIAKANMSHIATAIEQFNLAMGRYPTDDEGGLRVLVEPPEDNEEEKIGTDQGGKTAKVCCRDKTGPDQQGRQQEYLPAPQETKPA